MNIPKGILDKHKTLIKLHLLGFVFLIAYESKLPTLLETQNPQRKLWVSFAEKEGFEPPDLLQSTVFKTAAFDHSAISP